MSKKEPTKISTGLQPLVYYRVYEILCYWIYKPVIWFEFMCFHLWWKWIESPKVWNLLSRPNSDLFTGVVSLGRLILSWRWPWDHQDPVLCLQALWIQSYSEKILNPAKYTPNSFWEGTWIHTGRDELVPLPRHLRIGMIQGVYPLTIRSHRLSAYVLALFRHCLHSRSFSGHIFTCELLDVYTYKIHCVQYIDV